ncbi:hypothetical protein BDV29DRAFT_177003 [Aspergillus leporis]|jgi:hypothetical protein|uniref:Uncharacterized protein n=1 Tax=Aspergillus leporis TaxID=41062 RepID=A0A5N5WVY1_9EURO|nr:hypothetical protein BDV29DRAFT_177003 [Aspergillus leporis]
MFFNESFEDFHLDIVGFLAILGEGSVSVNYQVSTLSWFTFLPRLLPAPQAFMRPSRPVRLDDVPGMVLGIRSGNCRPHVYRIPHILLPGEQSMKISSDYTVRRFKIGIKKGEPGAPLITARTYGPLPLLAVLSCTMSIALLGLSIRFDDGWAVVATILLSCLSALLGLMCKWSLTLGKRPEGTGDTHIPDGDVIIYYPNGSFLIVECKEDIARPLFFAPERCNYLLSGTWYRSLALLGTMMLMFGVIALGNAGARMQVAFAASYLLLNAAYWMVAALPERLHWDYSALQIEEDVPRGLPDPPKEDPDGQGKPTFSYALWCAIKLTKSTKWVRTGRIAPDTQAWDKWLRMADDVANNRVEAVDPKTWNYSVCLKECLEIFSDRRSKSTENGL